jgi:hypothetical protein
MIINKKFVDLKGFVVYEVFLAEKRTIFDHDCDCEDDMEITEYEDFNNLEELLLALSDKTKDDIQKHYETEYDREAEVKLVNITFNAHSQDRQTEARMSIEQLGITGWATVEINNEDIDNRLLTNLEFVKKIVDNTLEEYPIKYSRE